jgi:hypothetical protein
MIALRIVLIIANALFLVFAAYLAWALGWMTNTYAEVKPWLAWAIVALFTVDLLYLLLHPALSPSALKSLGNSLKHRDAVEGDTEPSGPFVGPFLLPARLFPHTPAPCCSASTSQALP